MALVYLFDGSFDGLLCCVFTAFTQKEVPAMVSVEEGQQLVFGQKSQWIDTNTAHARRVEQGFRKKAGERALSTAIVAYHSGNLEKTYPVFRYLCLGFHVGRRITSLLAHPTVLEVQALEQRVLEEVHSLKGFVRFQKMKNQVFFAKLSPKSFVLPLLMPHFVDRFSVRPFVLYDTVHQVAGIYDTKRWEIITAEELNLPEFALEELQWQALWQSFFDTIAITERSNTKLQNSHCPLWHRQHMTEFQLSKKLEKQTLEKPREDKLTPKIISVAGKKEPANPLKKLSADSCTRP